MCVRDCVWAHNSIISNPIITQKRYRYTNIRFYISSDKSIASKILLYIWNIIIRIWFVTQELFVRISF